MDSVGVRRSTRGGQAAASTHKGEGLAVSRHGPAADLPADQHAKALALQQRLMQRAAGGPSASTQAGPSTTKGTRKQAGHTQPDIIDSLSQLSHLPSAMSSLPSSLVRANMEKTGDTFLAQHHESAGEDCGGEFAGGREEGQGPTFEPPDLSSVTAQQLRLYRDSIHTKMHENEEEVRHHVMEALALGFKMREMSAELSRVELALLHREVIGGADEDE